MAESATRSGASNTSVNSPATDAAQQAATAQARTPVVAQPPPVSQAFDPQAAIAEAMSKLKISPREQYIKPMPIVKMNLKYKPMEKVTKATHYIKYVPHVYSDALNYDFADNDY